MPYSDPKERQAYNKKYAIEHAQEIKSYHKKWNQENREYLLEYLANWKEENPDYEENWRINNRDKKCATILFQYQKVELVT